MFMQLGQLLKTSALFWLSSSGMANNNEIRRLESETIEEINKRYYPAEMKHALKNLQRDINTEYFSVSKPDLLYPNDGDFSDDIKQESDYHYHRYNTFRSNYNQLKQEFEEKLLTERQYFLTQGKAFAFGLDALFKETSQTNVKYHQVTAAYYQALYDVFLENDKETIINIFGKKANNVHALQTYRSLVIDIVNDIKEAKTDIALNKVLNDHLFVDQEGRFPKKIEHYSKPSAFSGQLVIRHAFKEKDKESFQKNDIVNVVLTINEEDIPSLVDPIKEPLLSFGVTEGRLTGTDDSKERHVSLALRVPYSSELRRVIDELNTRINTLRFRTSGNLLVVTPMDIRTSCSVLSEIEPDSEAHLKLLQHEIYSALENRGNNLPQMHITQGNAKTKPSTKQEIARLYEILPSLGEHLASYHLDLEKAFKEDNNTCSFSSAMCK